MAAILERKQLARCSQLLKEFRHKVALGEIRAGYNSQIFDYVYQQAFKDGQAAARTSKRRGADNVRNNAAQ